MTLKYNKEKPSKLDFSEINYWCFAKIFKLKYVIVNLDDFVSVKNIFIGFVHIPKIVNVKVHSINEVV